MFENLPTSGNDTIYGTIGDDFLEAYLGSDLLKAGEGNDTLTGGVGNHTLQGGLGDDQYRLESSASTYIIDDIGGMDTITFAPYALKGVYRLGSEGTPDAAGSDLHLTFTTFKVTIKNYFVTGEDGGHIETLKFSTSRPFETTNWQMSDVLEALQQAWPSLEDEHLYADPTGRPTLLDGGFGDDYLHSYFANDTLLGGAGNDTLVGSRGDNILEGGTGDDLYRMEETGGTDILFDEQGYDTALIAYVVSKFERAGTDLIVTSTHDSKLTIKDYFSDYAKGGRIEKLWFTAYAQDWSIPGRYWTVDDILAVVTDVDPGSGEQTGSPQPGLQLPEPATGLEAHESRTIIPDSDAEDRFTFSSLKAVEKRKHASIEEFTIGVDTIDLSGIDANSKAAGNNAFKTLLTGKKGFTKAGQLHYDKKTGILSGNTDKDAAAEFQILIKNKPASLSLGDFVL